MVTVAVALPPPVTEVGERVRLVGVGALTWTLAVLDVSL
jgi:hypothetical protein